LLSSFATGVSQSGFVKSLGGRPFVRSAIAFVLLASGVGNNEDALPKVRGTTRCRRNNLPLRVVPHLGQSRDDNVESSLDESGDVLHEDVAGSKVANNSGELGPEPARVFLRETLAGEGDGLAGEASADEVDSLCDCVDVVDVFVQLHVGPVMSEDGATVGVDLALPSHLHPRTLESEVESTDPTEEASDIHAASLVVGRRSSKAVKSNAW
jgi:hypothetical protein